MSLRARLAHALEKKLMSGRMRNLAQRAEVRGPHGFDPDDQDEAEIQRIIDEELAYLQSEENISKRHRWGVPMSRPVDSNDVDGWS